MDIAPELLEKIEKTFDDRIKNNQALKTLSAKLDKGEWGFLEAEHYALEVGKDLSSAFEKYLTVDSLPNGRMYYNIAEKIIPPMMYKEYELATDAAMEVVSLINERAGVRIAPQRPIIDENRVQGIVDKISDSEDFKSVQWLLGNPVQNFAVHCVDKTVETNALFQHRAGLRPRIKRDSGGKCCDWCAALDGMYEYPGVPRDIYMRHENCNCCVEYLPGDGSAQNVYAKTWRDMDAVEERIAFSERAMDNDEARERVLRIGELEKNTLQSRSIDGIVQSGARNELQSGAKKEEGWQDRHAERFYEEVRNRKPYSDANLIAKHIDGFSVEQLEEIRQHVFIREHPRSGGVYRFIPDYDQAEVWQRLTLNDNIRKSDITFLNHELLELTIMKEIGCSYEEAHAKANTVYNWWEEFVKGE